MDAIAAAEEVTQPQAQQSEDAASLVPALLCGRKQRSHTPLTACLVEVYVLCMYTTHTDGCVDETQRMAQRSSNVVLLQETIVHQYTTRNRDGAMLQDTLMASVSAVVVVSMFEVIFCCLIMIILLCRCIVCIAAVSTCVVERAMLHRQPGGRVHLAVTFRSFPEGLVSKVACETESLPECWGVCCTVHVALNIIDAWEGC